MHILYLCAITIRVNVNKNPNYRKGNMFLHQSMF